MDKKEMKKVVSETEKELREEAREKQITKVKEIVKRTLDAIEKVKEDKLTIDKRLKYLKMDLDDLKEGRLDRIEERQEKDPKAKENSVIIIIKEKEVIREREVPYPVYPSPWYWPYNITWNQPDWYYTNSTNGLDTLSYTNGTSINCSVAKDYSTGTYQIDGKAINFR